MNNYVRQLFGIMFQSKQTQQIVPIQPQPSATSPDEWRQHWQAKGFPWRTEPEIDAKRQAELSKCRAIVPDIEKGIYPFKGMKLSRADVEWLLAAHENGRGPIDWSDESQREHDGLDVRGADLCSVNLSNLPLACLRGGLSEGEWPKSEKDPLRYEVAVRMEKTILREAHLEGANLSRTFLERAILSGAHLEGANCTAARLQQARLRNAHLENANLEWAHLENAHLQEANLSGANLISAHMESVYLDNITLNNERHIGPRVADIHWDNVNLAVVKWSQIYMLGDEYKARQKKHAGKVKDKAVRLYEHEIAVRANRQLAVALQAQGLNEDAARFTYQAQVLERKVLWKQRNFWKWLGSAGLALLAGYGYRMWRILAAYLLIISICAVAYFIIGMYHPPHLTLLQAFLESITAFHGRVFYELFAPDTPQIWVTAFEAIAGLVIEGVFIAMLTQKFFGK